MHPDTALVSQLQTLDQRIATLEKEIATLPKHIAQIEKTLESHQRRLEADRAALVANQKDRKKLEGDIQMNEQKISKLRDQMLQAKNNEQYKAFQNEIDHFGRENKSFEEKILLLMTASEPLDAAVKQAEAALKEEQKGVEAEKAKVRERTAVDQKELDGLKAERTEAAKLISPATLKEYERIKKKSRGIAIADGTSGRCSACHILLRPQYMQDLRKQDQLLSCESCGRFLVYNPAVTVEGTRVAMS
jgi:predicted  nucleic acid-binding Zn-ribbon protein